MAWMYLLLRLALSVNPDTFAAKPATPVGPPRPVKYLVVGRQPMPPAYDVVVTPCQGKTAWPRMTLPANGQAMAATVESGRLHVRHCGTTNATARVEVKIAEAKADGGRCVYAADASLPLGVEKTVALAGDSPEPMCVRVRVGKNPAAAPSPFVGTGSIVLPPKVTNAEMMKRLMVYNAMPAPVPVEWLPPVPLHAASTACTMPAPMPLPVPVAHVIPPPLACPVPDLAVCRCVPTPSLTKTVRLVKESGKSKIELKLGSLSSKAVRHTVEDGHCGTIHLAAGTKRVHLSGREWKAQADRAELGADGTVTLHGHCKLSCDKLGEGATLAGEKLTFHVRNGHFVELAK